jgi:hypothetical protein
MSDLPCPVPLDGPILNNKAANLVGALFASFFHVLYGAERLRVALGFLRAHAPVMLFSDLSQRLECIRPCGQLQAHSNAAGRHRTPQ